jgi:hypothetical protein
MFVVMNLAGGHSLTLLWISASRTIRPDVP